MKSYQYNKMDKFKFTNQLKLIAAMPPNEQSISCDFSGVREQQPHLQGAAVKPMRCFYKDTELKVVTQGGMEFVNNPKQKIERVFPLQDGLIIQAEFRPDMYYYEPSGSNHYSRPSTSAYFSLLEHPLNDLHPLSIESRGGSEPSNDAQELLNSSMEIIDVCSSLPFMVTFDPNLLEVSFSLLKRVTPQTESDFGEDESFIRNLEPENRNPMMPTLSQSSQICLQRVFKDKICMGLRPSQVFVSQSPLDAWQMVVSLFVAERHELKIYTCDVRTMSSTGFRLDSVITKVGSVQQLDVQKHSQSIQMVNRELARGLSGHAEHQQPAHEQQWTSNLSFFKTQLHRLRQDLCLLDVEMGCLSIYLRGLVPVARIDLSRLPLMQISSRAPQQRRPSVLRISQADKSLLQLHLSMPDEKEKEFQCRVHVQQQVTDFAINSCLKVFKRILAADTFKKLLQDTFCLFQSDKGTSEQQFETFGNMLLSIISDKQSNLLSAKPSFPVDNKSGPTTRTFQSSHIKPLDQSVSSSLGGSAGTTRRRMATNVTSGTSAPVVRSKTGGTRIKIKKETNSAVAAPIPGVFDQLLKSDFHQNSPLADLFPVHVDVPLEPSASVKLENTPVSPIKRSPMKSVSSSSSPIKNKVPTNKLSPVKASKISDTYNLQQADIKPHLEEIFQMMHLLYEDLKLHRLRFVTEGPKLRKWLVALILHMDEPLTKASFLSYYLLEDTQNLKEFFGKQLATHLNGSHILDGQVPQQQVPQILRWVERQLRAKTGNYAFPIMFERTRTVCRLFEVLTQSSQSVFVALGQKQQVPFRNMTGDKEKKAWSNLLVPPSEQQTHQQKLQQFLFMLTESPEDYLMLSNTRAQLSRLHLFEKVLFCLKEEKWAMEQIKTLPLELQLPFQEIIRYTRLFQTEVQTVPVWPDVLYRLIKREDIINNQKSMHDQDLKLQREISGGSNIHNLRLQNQSSKLFALGRSTSNVFDGDSLKLNRVQSSLIQELIGLSENQLSEAPDQPEKAAKQETQGSQMAEFLKNKFGKDTRYREVDYLLSSQVDMILRQEAGSSDQNTMTDEEKIRSQKVQLDKLFKRHLSKCVGRGALSLGTQETIPTETLLIPKISQTYHTPQNNQGDAEDELLIHPAQSQQVLELQEREEREMVHWPQFHNGAASALKLAQSSFRTHEGPDKKVNQARNWIMYHKPANPKNEHGGFLLGLGLLGQLDSLQPTDIYQHLKVAHDLTTIGILLGRAASRPGKMDDSDSRTLCLHIPALLPQNLTVEISLAVQSAAVVGLGLLYLGTRNRLITEMLLAQIAKKPTCDKMIEREGYALSSGIALGLVNLSTGQKTSKSPLTESDGQLVDLELDQRLIRFIEGGKTLELPRSMLSSNHCNENVKSSAIRENDMVNINITSSGALFALTLIHLKSHNAGIASRLQFPETFFGMEFVRPALLMQKVVCKNLIMWDMIASTPEWVASQVPQIIQQIYDNECRVVEKMYNMRIGSQSIDYATVALCYVNILAGAIHCIGLKFAGTGNSEAKATILSYIDKFRKQFRVVPGTSAAGGPIKTNITSGTKNQVDKSTIDTCLSVAALALSMVMAGSCDVDSFRTLRVLRKRFEPEMHYGFNLSINTALGFLFLGSGAYTFSRSAKSIAALLCATYPVFPRHPSDNRFHLQALRHFYVMAIETRLLQARDIDTGKFVNVQVQVMVEDEANHLGYSTTSQQTPNIINGKILQIEVKDHPDYHDVCLRLHELGESSERHPAEKQFERTSLQQVIYVKRRNFYRQILSNHQQLTQVPPHQIEHASQMAVDKIKSINDLSIKAFVHNFVNLESVTTDCSIFDVLVACHRDTYFGEDRIPLQAQMFFETEELMENLGSQLVTHRAPLHASKLQQSVMLYESFSQDKATSLPLALSIHTNSQLLHAYHQFFNSHQHLFSKATPICGAPLSSESLSQVDTPKKSTDLQLLGRCRVREPYLLQMAVVLVRELCDQVSQNGSRPLVHAYLESQADPGSLNSQPLQQLHESVLQVLGSVFEACEVFDSHAVTCVVPLILKLL